jgi:hypothetical protein
MFDISIHRLFHATLGWRIILVLNSFFLILRVRAILGMSSNNVCQLWNQDKTNKMDDTLTNANIINIDYEIKSPWLILLILILQMNFIQFLNNLLGFHNKLYLYTGIRDIPYWCYKWITGHHKIRILYTFALLITYSNFPQLWKLLSDIWSKNINFDDDWHGMHFFMGDKFVP